MSSLSNSSTLTNTMSGSNTLIVDSISADSADITIANIKRTTIKEAQFTDPPTLVVTQTQINTNLNNLITRNYADNIYLTASSALNTFVSLTTTESINGLKTFLQPPILDGTNITRLSKVQISGIQNIDDTSDINKPVSIATQNSLNLKANQTSISNIDNTSDINKPISTATQNALNLKSNLASPNFTGIPVSTTAALGTNTTQIATTAFVIANSGSSGSSILGTNNIFTGSNQFNQPIVTSGTGITGLTKAQVGLTNVDNTSDANKAVSTATQSALNLKANQTSISNINNTSDLQKPVSSAQQAALNLKAELSSNNRFTGSNEFTQPIVSSGTSITGLTKTQIGLSNVDNTSDINKPISTATQSALDLKANQSSISNIDNTSDVNKPVSTAQQAALDLKVNLTSNNRFTGINEFTQPIVSSGTSITGLTKTQVGLSNVDNSSDILKPISSATQSALDLKATITSVNLKANIDSQTFTGICQVPQPPANDYTSQIATTKFVIDNASGGGGSSLLSTNNTFIGTNNFTNNTQLEDVIIDRSTKVTRTYSTPSVTIPNDVSTLGTNNNILVGSVSIDDHFTDPLGLCSNGVSFSVPFSVQASFPKSATTSYTYVMSFSSLVLQVFKNGVLLLSSPNLAQATSTTAVIFGSQVGQAGPSGSINNSKIGNLQITSTSNTTSSGQAPNPTMRAFMTTSNITFNPDNSQSTTPDLYEFYINYNFIATQNGTALSSQTFTLYVNPSSTYYTQIYRLTMSAGTTVVNAYFPVTNTLINPNYRNFSNTNITTATVISSNFTSYGSQINGGYYLTGDIQTAQWVIRIIGNSELGFGRDSTNNLYATKAKIGINGAYTAVSDRNLKNDIQDLNKEHSYNRILALNPKHYRFNDSPEEFKYSRSVGFIAQEIEIEIPYCVSYISETEKTKGVAYNDVLIHLVSAFQKQTEIMNKQEERITKLEEFIKNM
jgi:hypothetical protein